MADVTRGQLEQAYALIQDDRLDDAISLLKGIIARNPDHEDAWWLMANAVSEPEDAYNALSNVLRINPSHADAREAYDQLMVEYPNLGKRAVAASADFGDDMSVDIDELLAKTTGVLDPNADVSPMMRKPPTDKDVSSFYLDQAWASREAEQATTQGETGNSPDDLDLDDLFGSQAADTPVTATEDQDLEDIFSGITPGTRRPPTPPPARPAPAPAAQTTPPQDATDLDDFFGGPLDEPAPARPAAVSEPDFGADIDDIFGPGTDEPFGRDKEPGFVSGMPAEAPAEKPGRRRRGKQDKQAETEAVLEEVAVPAEGESGGRRRREKAPRPVVVEPEPLPRDPFDEETTANRRRWPRLALVALLLIVVLVVGAFILLPRVTAPDAVGQAAQKIAEELSSKGYSEVSATRNGDAVQVSLCSNSGRALQSRIYEAMDVIAAQLSPLTDGIRTAQIEVSVCGKPDVKLYRAAAPIDAIMRYVESGQANKREYRASWQRN